MLNQNTHCHEISTSAPPSTGPMTRPTAATIVFVPIARPSWLRGNASVTRAAALAKDRAADALQDPPEDQLRAVGREAGAERGGGEDREADDVGLLAAEEVRQPAGREDEHGRGDHVGEDHPDELQQRRVEAALEVGQRDDQRARVDGRQQHAEAGARQRPPLVVLVVGGDADAAPRGEGLLLKRHLTSTLACPSAEGPAGVAEVARRGRGRGYAGTVTRRPTVPLLVALRVLPRVRADGPAGARVARHPRARRGDAPRLRRARPPARAPRGRRARAPRRPAAVRGRRPRARARRPDARASVARGRGRRAAPRHRREHADRQAPARPAALRGVARQRPDRPGGVAQRPLDRGDDARAVRRPRLAARTAAGRRGVRRRVRGGRRLRRPRARLALPVRRPRRVPDGRRVDRARRGVPACRGAGAGDDCCGRPGGGADARAARRRRRRGRGRCWPRRSWRPRRATRSRSMPPSARRLSSARSSSRRSPARSRSGSRGPSSALRRARRGPRAAGRASPGSTAARPGRRSRAPARARRRRRRT